MADEMNQELAVDGLKKSVRAMIQIQWDLADYGTLGDDIQVSLTRIGDYYLNLLQVIDPVQANELHAELMRNAKARPGKSPVQSS